MNPLALLIVIAAAFAVLFGMRRRRENFRRNLRILILALAAGFLTFAVAQAAQIPNDTATLGAIIVSAVVAMGQPKRSRYIPASVRRQKRAEWELRTGKKFNPKKHHLDHIVPFSDGGSHTADNLRVLEKRANLRKGAKAPWWDLIGKM